MDLTSTSGSIDYVLPSPDAIEKARAELLPSLPNIGIGSQRAIQHVQNDIVSGLNSSSQSANYYGFVTGGVTPAAAAADNVVTEHDQNLAVHLPCESVATDVEDRALAMVCELLDLEPRDWPHRTFTTGATASNVVGLACAREGVVAAAAMRCGQSASVAEHGLAGAMHLVGVEDVQILTTVPHSSLRKSASVVGLGRASIKDVGSSGAPHRFDMAALERHLQRPKTASIVAVSCAEVNSGLFATDGESMRKIRALCDQHGAWIHVDAAFGLLARALPASDDYRAINAGVDGLDLADSITGDAHKLLNVPYDCGIFLSRHLPLAIEVFQNPNAAYLDTPGSAPIPSPLNIGIENSRRFRALPVYATLAASGRAGYADMLARQIQLARGIARLILASDAYELLPPPPPPPPPSGLEPGEATEARLAQIYIVVLFRARDAAANATLVRRLNATRRLYVSGTQWGGAPATRFAVANWQVDVARDLRLVEDVLRSIEW